jgi:hypothetical protein
VSGWERAKEETKHNIQTQEHSGTIIASDHGQSLPVATVLYYGGLSNNHHVVVVPCGADQGNLALDPWMDERLTRALLPSLSESRLLDTREEGLAKWEKKDLWS